MNRLGPRLAQLAEALEAFPLPVFSVDTGGTAVWQNGAARATFGDLRGRHYEQVIAPEELAATRERFARTLRGEPGRRARNVIRLTTGELVAIEVATTALREGGKVVGVLGIAVPLGSRYEPPEGGIRLTPRQHEVLELLVEGKSTSQIAERLHLAPVTVRNYIRGLLRALNAGSRLEAVLTALREDLISLDPDALPLTRGARQDAD
jgi:PAS domain S-box-containing protein